MVDRAPPDGTALVHCPFCQVIMANDGTMAGQLARCPTCRNHFVMPGLAPVAQFVALDSPARVTQPIQQPLPASPAPTASAATAPEVPVVAGAVTPGVMPVVTSAAPTPGLSGPHVAPKEAPAPVASAPAPVSANVSGLPAVVQAAAAAGLPVIDFAPGFHPEPKAKAKEPAPVAPVPVATPVAAPTAPTMPVVQTHAVQAPALQMPALHTPAQPNVPLARPKAPPAAAPQAAPQGMAPQLAAQVAPGFGKLGFHPSPVSAPVPAAAPALLMPSGVQIAGLPAAAPPAPAPDQTALASMHETQEQATSSTERAVAAAPAWLVSAVIHAVLVIFMGMWVIVTQPEIIPLLVDVNWSKDLGQQLERTNDIKVETPEPVDPLFTESEVAVPVEEPAPNLPVVVPLGEGPATKAFEVQQPGSLGGRGEGSRAAALKHGGATVESEAAVALGLKWLKEHQNADGSWSFRHGTCPRCNNKCRHNGVIGSPTGATAMALLPFLGAGQSHREGKYQETVRKGLYYLVNQIKRSTPRGRASGNLGGEGVLGDLQGPGGNMYCHGLASIALCEAYGMTQDGGLRDGAQRSLDFIVYAQDKDGGGWRYSPGDRGDTSVVGWQLMALKSGHMAYLKVPPETVNKAILFLDSVQGDGGSVYGYTSPGQGGATTAIGLLCRMYLGWKRDNAALERGVAALSQEGPSKDDMYYNYYATQVMHHYGGDEWKKWNSVMRDQLIKSQGKQGHEEGSWWSPHPWNATGGRLYQTSLSIMTLEVYYRHLPIYRDDSVNREFK